MEFGGFDELPGIFKCLRDDHAVIRNKAAEAFLFFWEKAGSQNIKETGFRSLPFDAGVLDYFRIDFDDNTYLSLIRIASVNRSGFVREKSVNELGRLRSRENLKFILFRLGDWVEQVRFTAITTLRTYLAPEYVRWWLGALPLIDQQLEVQRVDLAAIHEEIVQFILSHASMEDVNAIDDAARLRYYRHFFRRRRIDESLAITIYGDSNFVIRLLVLTQSTALDRQFQQSLVCLALKDSATLVKMKALNAARQFLPDVLAHLRPLLLDKAYSVRDLSRTILKPTGMDFIDFYKNSLETGSSVSGGVMGLCDVGGSDNLSIFQKHACSAQGRVSAGCLVALEKFDRQLAVQYSLEMLGHRSGVVRRNAIRILAAQVTHETLEEIRERFRLGDFRIKVATMTAYKRIGGWSVLADMIDSLLDESTDVKDIGWQMLSKLRIELARLFVPGHNEDLERARQSLQRVRVEYNKGITNWQDSLLKDIAFFIR
jgi:hypothetical protein